MRSVCFRCRYGRSEKRGGHGESKSRVLLRNLYLQGVHLRDELFGVQRMCGEQGVQGLCGLQRQKAGVRTERGEAGQLPRQRMLIRF